RFALAKRREDVDREVERAEQLPPAAVAHWDAVLQDEKAVVALERKAEVRLDPDEDQGEPASGVDEEHIVGVRMGERVELALARRHRHAGRLYHRRGAVAGRAGER